MTLSKETRWFAGIRYERNLFDDFAYQNSNAIGMGRFLGGSKSNKRSAELGAGYLREQPEALAYSKFGEVSLRRQESASGEPTVHVGAQYIHRVSANASLVNLMFIETSATNTMRTGNCSVQVKAHKNLALVFGVDVTNNMSPPAGQVRHTQTETTLALTYNFISAKNVSASQPLPTLLQGLRMP